MSEDEPGRQDPAGQDPQRLVPSRASRHQPKRKRLLTRRPRQDKPPDEPGPGSGGERPDPSWPNTSDLFQPAEGAPRTEPPAWHPPPPEPAAPTEPGSPWGAPPEPRSRWDAPADPAGPGGPAEAPPWSDAPADPGEATRGWGAPAEPAAAPWAPAPDAAPPPGEAVAGDGDEGAAWPVGRRAREGSGRGRGRARPRPAIPTPPRVALPGLAASGMGMAVAVLAVAAVLVLAVNALPAARPPATPAAAPPYSARWVCPLYQGQSGTVSVANVGRTTATLRTTMLTAATPSSPVSKTLAAGAVLDLPVKATHPGYVQVEAFRAPVVVSDATGTGCSPGPSNRWWLPAASNGPDTETTVVIANPDSEPAVVALVPHLSTGALQAPQEIFVPPNSAVARPPSVGLTAGLNPSIEAVAKAGRVVVGGVVGGKGGGRPLLLPGQPALRSDWSFAGGQAGGGKDTSLLVTNPNQSPLLLNVQVSTAKGTFKPAGRFDDPIAPGGTAALSFPDVGVAAPFAVRVRAEGSPRFAAALRVTEGGGKQAGVTFDLGASDPTDGWLLPEPPSGGKVVLANLSSRTLQARFTDLARPGGSPGAPLAVPAGRVALGAVPKGAKNLLLKADGLGLVAAPLGDGTVVSGTAVGGLEAEGPIVPGPAAAP